MKSPTYDCFHDNLELYEPRHKKFWVYVVALSIIHTCMALRYKPAFTATQQSVGLARKRSWFDPRTGQKVISIFIIAPL